jgi:hypothetical protein
VRNFGTHNRQRNLSGHAKAEHHTARQELVPFLQIDLKDRHVTNRPDKEEQHEDTTDRDIDPESRYFPDNGRLRLVWRARWLQESAF